MTTRIHRYEALARELTCSVNTVGALAYFGLVVDDGDQARLLAGETFASSVRLAKELQILCDWPAALPMGPNYETLRAWSSVSTRSASR